MYQKGKTAPTFLKERQRFSLYSVLFLVLSLTGLLLLLVDHSHPRYTIFSFYPQTHNDEGSPHTTTHTPPPVKQSSLYKLNLDKHGGTTADLLNKIQFKNYGVTRSEDKFTWKNVPCHYVESQNVSAPYVSWSDNNHFNYLFRQVGDNDLLNPATGIRSSVPLGGLAAGVVELRGDGSFHEWTIFNQHPAGAAKIQILDDVFMGLRTEVQHDNTTESLSLVLQTHPVNEELPGVKGLEYRGSYPVSKLSVLDARVPIDASIYAYSWYKHNDLNMSATPAVAFTAVLHNPLDRQVNASFMFNLPLGVEPHTQRSAKQMPKFVPILEVEEAPVFTKTGVIGEMECFKSCNNDDICKSWSYDVKEEVCTMYGDVRLNGHLDGSYAGVKSSWTKDKDCMTINRDTQGSSTNGNMSLCVISSDDSVVTSMGFGDDVTSLWKDFSNKGGFPSSPDGPYVSGAVSGSVSLGAGETKEVTIVMGWYFPDRDFLGIPVGNFYRHLVDDSADAASLLGANLDSAISDISKLHSTFFDSDLPVTIQDMLINSLSQLRSAFWLEDGRWRQWEAVDCVNIDSVHNDGERHIPYMMIFPETVINKMYAWAGFQLDNGMIQEELRCGCMSLPIDPISVEFGCGRSMPDVSSMFTVYLLELLQWYPGNGTQQVVQDLWPNAKRAAQWQMDVGKEDGMPKYLWTTYDYVFLNSYPFTTYTGAFQLLAMKAAEKLAYLMGDIEFALECHAAFLRSQELVDKLMWNETAQYYNAYTMTAKHKFNAESYFRETNLNLCEFPEYRPEGARVEDCMAGRPDTPGAIMADSFYAQVLAYSLGLGTLVKYEDRLRLHMKAELQYNDSPLGLLVVTGRYPVPGPDADNSLWMMANPNWATINLHLGEDPNFALEVGKKSFEQWRSVLHEQWNVAGIMGGIGYGVDGLPHITSHYGFYMSSWHMIMALSGQQVDVLKKSITFAPKIKPPFKIPFFIPTVWGYIESDVAPQNVSKPEELHVFYTLALHFGSVDFEHLSVDSCKFEMAANEETVNIDVDSAAKWHCLYN